MKNARVTRREFVDKSVKLAAGVTAGLAASSATVLPGADKNRVDTSKILNYNENMEYRRQGSTNLMISAVCMGGHSGMNDKARYEAVSRAIDHGINYIDACTRGEVLRDSKALKGRRDKMYLALSHCGNEIRNPNFRTSKKLLEVLDGLLLESGQEYTDLWRVTCYEPGGRHSFNTACELVDALTKAKEQGKARFVGFSTHDRRWIEMMVEYFPVIDCVCFPFTTMSKKAPKDSVFAALKKCDVGAFGIKPYGAGSLFSGAGDSEDKNRLARLALRYIMNTNTVHPIPGVNRPEEVDNIAKAVVERRELDTKETADLKAVSQKMWANLPRNYQWLRNWETV